MEPRLHLETARVRLYHGDAADAARVIAPESIDAIVTDPPAGIGFMNREWDRDKGGRDAWIAWLAGILRSAMTLLKPGGHALIWALPRTAHWTATAVEDAGFEVRDKVFHLFGSGFPKSLDVSKAIDDALGAERKVVGEYRMPPDSTAPGYAPSQGLGYASTSSSGVGRPITAPATPEAAKWPGWHTALKPSVEEWILARKPLRGNVAANVMRYGTGAINVDACRIGGAETIAEMAGRSGASTAAAVYGEYNARQGWEPSRPGRWPAHLVLSHLPECEEIGMAESTTCAPGCAVAMLDEQSAGAGGGSRDTPRSGTRAIDAFDFGEGPRPTYADTGGASRFFATFRCAPGCPVAMLDEQSGNRESGNRERGTYRLMGYGAHGDAPMPAIAGSTGGASRFFYCAKPARSEKDAGLDHLPLRTGGEATDREDGSAGLSNPRAGAGRGGGVRNHHPTVKSIDLMRWLCRLITPPGGTVLDLFAGSGTTGVAALREGFNFVGIEREAAFVDVAAGRLAHVECIAPPPLADTTTPAVKPRQASLFDLIDPKKGTP